MLLEMSTILGQDKTSCLPALLLGHRPWTERSEDLLSSRPSQKSGSGVNISVLNVETRPRFFSSCLPSFFFVFFFFSSCAGLQLRDLRGSSSGYRVQGLGFRGRLPPVSCIAYYCPGTASLLKHYISRPKILPRHLLFKFSVNFLWSFIEVLKQGWAEPALHLEVFGVVPVPPIRLPHPFEFKIIQGKRG